MSESIEIGRLGDEREVDRLHDVLTDAFAETRERSERYVGALGRERFRIVRRGGRLIGALAVIETGQWFGGCDVPMGGVAAVAVAPEARALGVATRLLRAALEEMRAGGLVLSALYPATLALYRRVGYEVAGGTWEVLVPAQRIDLRDRTLAVREATEDDAEAIRGVHREWARRQNGPLTRNSFFWQNVRDYRDRPTRGYVVTRGNAIEGYTYVATQVGEMHDHHARLADVAFTTTDAARRLLTLFADYRTTREKIGWRTYPSDPLLALLAEAPYDLRLRVPWMLRIVDVAGALGARGYPAGVSATLEFDVQDDVLSGNNGRWVLEVADGRGQVRQGGAGRLKLGVRALAALYTGHFGPEDLALAGWLDAAPEDRAAAAPVFAGPTPWMREEF